MWGDNMGLIETASGKSAWRGYEYYLEKKVSLIEKISDTLYRGSVSGSEKSPYITTIDISHPKKSICNCHFAKDRPVVCKHMAALYFTLNLSEAASYYDSIMAAEDQAEEEENEIYDKVIEYVHGLKKDMVAALLLEYLFDGPEISPMEIRFCSQNRRNEVIQWRNSPCPAKTYPAESAFFTRRA